jgi:hypothetical protein
MKTLVKARRLITLTLPLLSILGYGFAPVQGLAQNSASQRVLEDKLPAHLPIKVKVKNLEKDKWLDELEVEVRNTGDKPIYYLSFAVVTPEVTAYTGDPMGFPLRYGNMELVDAKKRPEPEDVPINPGEIHVFKLSEREVKGWKRHRTDSRQADPKKIVLVFNSLRFGDGTGFTTTGGVPFPSKKVSRNTCGKERKESAAAATGDYLRSTRPPDTFPTSSFSFLPVSSLPANFLGTFKLTGSTAGVTNAPDLCCPGTSCSYLEQIYNGANCMCGPADWVQTAPCSGMGTCGKIWTIYRVCFDDDDNEMWCPNFYINPCDGWDGI